LLELAQIHSVLPPETYKQDEVVAFAKGVGTEGNLFEVGKARENGDGLRKQNLDMLQEESAKQVTVSIIYCSI